MATDGQGGTIQRKAWNSDRAHLDWRPASYDQRIIRTPLLNKI